MSVNCCGRNCTDCVYYENRECAGCDQKSLTELTSDCKIAKCCIENCYESCKMCSFMKDCPLTGKKEKLIKDGKLPKKPYAPLTLQTESYSSMLAKWFRVLILLTVPITAATLAISKTASLLTFLGNGLGKIIFVVFALLYAAVLLRISKASTWYRYTALGYVAEIIVTLIAFSKAGSGVTEVFVLLIQGAVIFGTQYIEMKTNADVIEDVNPDLAEKWRKMWIWYVLGWVAILIDAIVMLFIPFAGFIIFLAANVEMCVVMIVRMVLLEKSAKAFARDAVIHHS